MSRLPPAKVRKEAKLGLELRKKWKRGGTSVGVARGVQLSSGKAVSDQTIKRMYSYFQRHQHDRLDKDGSDGSIPGRGYIAWLLWGGNSGRKWAESEYKKLQGKKKNPISKPVAAVKKSLAKKNIFLIKVTLDEFRFEAWAQDMVTKEEDFEVVDNYTDNDEPIFKISEYVLAVLPKEYMQDFEFCRQMQMQGKLEKLPFSAACRAWLENDQPLDWFNEQAHDRGYIDSNEYLFLVKVNNPVIEKKSNPARNILNPEAIKKHAEGLVKTLEASDIEDKKLKNIKKWMLSNYVKGIINSDFTENYLFLIGEEDRNFINIHFFKNKQMPDWVKKAYENNEKIYVFAEEDKGFGDLSNLFERITDIDFNHFIDFIKTSNFPNDPSRVSFDQMRELVHQWDAEDVKIKDEDKIKEGEKLYKEYADGMKWVLLTNKEAMQNESRISRMGHCIGRVDEDTGTNDYIRLVTEGKIKQGIPYKGFAFSLRDKENNPYATAFYVKHDLPGTGGATGYFNQIKGYSNCNINTATYNQVDKEKRKGIQDRTCAQLGEINSNQKYVADLIRDVRRLKKVTGSDFDLKRTINESGSLLESFFQDSLLNIIVTKASTLSDDNFYIFTSEELSSNKKIKFKNENERISRCVFEKNIISLKALPPDFEVDGDLYLNGFASLKELPAGLKVGRDLNLVGCTSLKELPADLKVGRDLNLNQCTSLKELPADLEVGEDLLLFGCTSLQSLPPGLKVSGYLDLRRCTSLKELPAGLKVWNLNLVGCTSLKELPAGLKVWNLNLVGCTSLKELPADLKVSGEIFLPEHLKKKENPTKEIFYHLSSADFNKFKQTGDTIGFHFGTKEQAIKRGEMNILKAEVRGYDLEPHFNLYTVQLDIKRPLKISENRGGNHGFSDLIDDIFKEAENGRIPEINENMLTDRYNDIVKVGRINIIDYSNSSSDKQLALFSKFLSNLGYDSISYENEYEGEGLSYVVFDPEKIKIISKEKIDLSDYSKKISEADLSYSPEGQIIINWKKENPTREEEVQATKEHLLELARECGKRPTEDTALGSKLSDYLQSDRALREKLKELCPDWFSNPKGSSEQTKAAMEMFLEMARRGEKRPSSTSNDPKEKNLGNILSHYISRNSEFAENIYKANKEWTIKGKAEIIKETKNYLVELARECGTRPPKDTALGSKLSDYLVLDKKFKEKMKELCPDWFRNTTTKKEVKEAMEMFLEMARRGEKRPSDSSKNTEEIKLADQLTNFLQRHPKFRDQILIIAPEWFASEERKQFLSEYKEENPTREEEVEATKEHLLELARECGKRPTEDTALGIKLSGYLARDKAFKTKIKELCPDWFRTSGYGAKEETKATMEMFLEMALNGEKRPTTLSNNPEEKKLGVILLSLLMRYPEFKEKIYQTNREWTAGGQAEVVKETKNYLLELARECGTRPRFDSPLGVKLAAYVKTDEAFRKKMQELCPSWFRQKLGPREETKAAMEMFLEMARNGKKRPADSSKNPEEKKLAEMLMGILLRYPEFRKKVLEANRDWFTSEERKKFIAEYKEENPLSLIARGFDERPASAYDREELKKGIKTELEHTEDAIIASKIAKDHLDEDPQYYSKLIEMESKMKNPTKMYLFSYGSNNPQQLAERLERKVKTEGAYAEDTARIFVGHSNRWDGAVASVEGQKGKTVYGLIVEVNEDDLKKMDRYEGVSSKKYKRSKIKVKTKDGKEIEAVVYVSLNTTRGKPSEEYLQAIVKTIGAHWKDSKGTSVSVKDIKTNNPINSSHEKSEEYLPIVEKIVSKASKGTDVWIDEESGDILVGTMAFEEDRSFDDVLIRIKSSGQIKEGESVDDSVMKSVQELMKKIHMALAEYVTKKPNPVPAGVNYFLGNPLRNKYDDKRKKKDNSDKDRFQINIRMIERSILPYLTLSEISKNSPQGIAAVRLKDKTVERIERVFPSEEMGEETPFEFHFSVLYAMLEYFESKKWIGRAKEKPYAIIAEKGLETLKHWEDQILKVKEFIQLEKKSNPVPAGVDPEEFDDLVKKLKKRKDVDNPYALANWILKQKNPTKFEKLAKQLEAKGVDDPKALAAWIGRQKYGKEEFQRRAAAGRRKKSNPSSDIKKDFDEILKGKSHD